MNTHPPAASLVIDVFDDPLTLEYPAALWAEALLGAPLTRLSAPAAEEMARRIVPTSDGVLLRLAAPYRPLDPLLVQWSLTVNRAWCAERGEWDGDLVFVARFVRPRRHGPR